MKKRMLSLALAVTLILCLFSGRNNTSAESGSAADKVLNIYVRNDEFQGKFNANCPEVKKPSNDRSITCPTARKCAGSSVPTRTA